MEGIALAFLLEVERLPFCTRALNGLTLRHAGHTLQCDGTTGGWMSGHEELAGGYQGDGERVVDVAHRWLMPKGQTSYGVAERICSGPWRLPTAMEFFSGQAQGMCGTKLRGAAMCKWPAWTADGEAVGPREQQTDRGGAAPYCIERGK